MEKIRELTKEDWRLIEKALDFLLRCRLGQFGVLFDEFLLEFISRINHDEPNIFGKVLTKKEKNVLVDNVTDALENAKVEIAVAAFGALLGSKDASFGIKSLDDPVRELGIQATLRRCNFSEDLSKCPFYPNNCHAPLTGFCPKKE